MAIVPRGGLVLVTGANGYLGSVAVKTLLLEGYRVRGTVRDMQKHSWMQDYFGPEFSLVEVRDMTAAGAFVSAVDGVDGILHMAANVAPGPHDEAAVDEGAQAATSLLSAAHASASVKRVVLTSSVAACLTIRAGKAYSIGSATWNSEALAEASRPWDGQNPSASARSTAIYSALKARTEQVAFAWVAEHNPGFVFNSVVPDLTIGTLVAPEHMGYRNSSALLELFFRGLPDSADILCAQWFINVTDAAYIHLGALTQDDVRGERLFAAAGRYSWNGILEIMKRRFPNHKTSLETIHEPAVDCGNIDNQRAEEVLRRVKGSGWVGLEDTVVEVGQSLLAAYQLPTPPRNPHEALLAKGT